MQGHVTLVSSDGFEFVLSRKCAMEAGTIKSMLSGPGQFLENEKNEIILREIPARILERICAYIHYKNRYTNAAAEIPEFPIDPAISLELLMAASFLEI